MRGREGADTLSEFAEEAVDRVRFHRVARRAAGANSFDCRLSGRPLPKDPHPSLFALPSSTRETGRRYMVMIFWALFLDTVRTPLRCCKHLLAMKMRGKLDAE